MARNGRGQTGRHRHGRSRRGQPGLRSVAWNCPCLVGNGGMLGGGVILPTAFALFFCSSLSLPALCTSPKDEGSAHEAAWDAALGTLIHDEREGEIRRDPARADMIVKSPLQSGATLPFSLPKIDFLTNTPIGIGHLSPASRHLQSLVCWVPRYAYYQQSGEEVIAIGASRWPATNEPDLSVFSSRDCVVYQCQIPGLVVGLSERPASSKPISTLIM